MYVVAVEFEIEPSASGDFISLVQVNAATSRETEAGCHRFDVCWNEVEPEKVFLYELYEDRVAFDAHLAAPHFAEFDQAIASMVRTKRIVTYDRVAA